MSKRSPKISVKEYARQDSVNEKDWENTLKQAKARATQLIETSTSFVIVGDLGPKSNHYEATIFAGEDEIPAMIDAIKAGMKDHTRRKNYENTTIN